MTNRRRRFNGLVSRQISVNLRWPLRLVCRFTDHEWQQVISIHPFLGGPYRYCKRCGQGWRTKGLAHTPRFCRHHWENNGEPSTWTETGEPFRQIQQCGSCGATRCIECATGEVVT